MRRRSRASAKSAEARRRKRAKPKRRSAAKAYSRAGSAASRQAEIAQLIRERDQAVQQQTAAADVLRIISRSTFDLQTVLDTLVESACRHCDAYDSIIFLRQGERLNVRAHHGPLQLDFDDWPIQRSWITGRAVVDRTIVHVYDPVAFAQEYPDGSEMARRLGYRTILSVPMLRGDEPVGALTIRRSEVKPFTDKEIKLVETFAAQAVIAIENARLLGELRQRTDDLTESLEQQTATAEVLRVISSSTGALTPVFAAMLQNAVRICGARFGNLLLRDADTFRVGATHGAPPAYVEFLRQEAPFRVDARLGLGRMLDTKETYQVADIAAAPTHGDKLRIATIELAGARTVLGVPMLKDGEMIGCIIIYRQEVRPFDGKQIELVQNFAAQAVIAIENARLLNELRQRTTDLTESLQQQTATSNVLEIISRSAFDLQPVFDTVAENAVKLCGADRAFIFRFDGEMLRCVVSYNAPLALEQFIRSNPIRPDRSSAAGRAAYERRTVHIPDVKLDPEYTFKSIDAAPVRTILTVPILKGAELFGVILTYSLEVRPFSDKQIALVETFADQAAIAVENVKLFEAEQQRTRELSVSLGQQTATADVLRVISSSPGELEPVFQAIMENATRICQAEFGTLNLYDGDAYRTVALHNPPPQFAQRLGTIIRPHPESGLAHVARTRQIAHIDDIRTRQPYLEGNQAVADLADLANARTLLIVPMLKEGKLVGAISIYRQEVRLFTDRQVELVKNFAAQAVIAIENTRLLNELRESLDRQTATADVLKVISRSAFNLQTVLQTLVESAARLCDADKATITRQKGEFFYRAESYGFSAAFMDSVRDIPVVPERRSATGRALLEGKVVHIPDVHSDPDYQFGEALKHGEFRTILGVPMLREGVAIGVFTLTRAEVRPFSQKQIELVSIFADQAAIAIENVRLFEAEQQRTQELAKSLEDLRTAQDRLVQTQKLASLGQLTAGIAHEIKNPLNFVNNFSGVSVELIEELQDALRAAPLDAKARADIDDLADTLRGNLDKIAQHGKRADSIVKNMLLHSREGSGEQRAVDINAIVEESLNLAYHGARAESQGFTIAIERSFDPDAGQADLYPQEISRALLNFIANGFYAATKRGADVAGNGHEPRLAASTKSLGNRVEIRIRDNGIGIPPEVKEKMFNPFFTTKPAGEGTGLGLSISHDIIVKQHAGSIEVDSAPGEFTEIRIILPRTAA
ncbi:MAG TPA: GAF domain-containing protein [Xanthobacteraceae bacterium]|nr:GAF domain-containing protein [Xanthobacteraceae bacterium]